ncbi:serine hydrolase domain-containing protein [Streptomyces klenkii]|uniref:serine hydrolase domain-containing protein n=1 Tax=Streptomyces klenkii TaxID=1420899 RepID=UPI0033AD1EF7
MGGTLAGFAHAADTASCPAARQGASSPAAVSIDRGKLQKDIDALVKGGVTGIQVQVTDGSQQLALRGGVAERGTSKPIADQSHFRMGSNTKTFVATVMLQLVGENKISLDDTVDSLLKDNTSRSGKNITVRQLLQHTSGLADYEESLFSSMDAFNANRWKTYQPQDLVHMALDNVPQPTPGTWSYSSANYILAGMIIEKVTGNSWAQEVKARITEPLGLSHTSSPGTATSLPQPHTQADLPTDEDGTWLDITELNPSWAGAAGDMITTPDDLTRFWRALLQGQLLKPAQQAEMQTTVDAVSDALPARSQAGLGLFKTSSHLACSVVCVSGDC